MLDGFLYLVLDLGYGVEKVVAYGYRLDDSLQHRVTLTHHSKKGTIDVDGESNSYKIKTRNHDKQQTSFDVYLGGLGPSKMLPHQIWTAPLNQGYVGCMQDLLINGENVDLTEMVVEQNEVDAMEIDTEHTVAMGDPVPGVELQCRVTQPQCPSYPCLHNGVCRDGWNRYVCDCSGTAFTGSTCQQRK